MFDYCQLYILLYLASSLTSEAMSAAQVSAQYGDNRFVLISLEAAQADAYFRICNEFMLRG